MAFPALREPIEVLEERGIRHRHRVRAVNVRRSARAECGDRERHREPVVVLRVHGAAGETVTGPHLEAVGALVEEEDM